MADSPPSTSDMLTMQEQQRNRDKDRTTEGLDYNKVKTEALALIDIHVKDKKNYYRRGAAEYPEFKARFPKFFDTIGKLELTRTAEFRSVLDLIIGDLLKVSNGQMTHTEMREKVFEKELAQKYYKPKQ